MFFKVIGAIFVKKNYHHAFGMYELVFFKTNLVVSEFDFLSDLRMGNTVLITKCTTVYSAVL